MAINLANNNSLANITALPSSISGGGMTLISEQTASGSATIDFTSGIDSTYDSYVFKFYDIHPATDGSAFQFQGSTNSGSSYGVTITSSRFLNYHDELDSYAALAYDDGNDLAQSTSFQNLFNQVGNDNDQNGNGTLQIFNPSSTTYVKHFISTTNYCRNSIGGNNGTQNSRIAGYYNTTSVINAIQFKMSSGNIDSGVIKLYGVS
jgi:hypothetical protein